MENLERQTAQNLFGLSSKKERNAVELEENLETLSRYLDGLFRIPGIGWKFGLDSLIGLIPGGGDALTALLSFYILASGVRYGVPKITLLRMALNIAIDFVVGSIPFVGDIFDFAWRSNKMNMDLLRERATGRGQGTTGDWLFVGFIILLLLGLLAGSLMLSVFIFGTLFYQIWQFLAQI
jgi:hypothetical protein